MEAEVKAIHAGGTLGASLLAPIYSPVTGEQLGWAHVTRISDVERAIGDLLESQDLLAALDFEDLANHLYDLAQELDRLEPTLIEALILDAGMTREEAVEEVSAAVRLAENPPRPSPPPPYAPRGFEAGLRLLPGVALVVAPYTSPLAAPIAAVVHALSHGLPVLVKPSMKAPLATAMLVEALHRAGLGKHVSLVVGPGGRLAHTARDPRVRAVISYTAPQTALALRRAAPTARLLCNRMGRTAAIVTPTADAEAVGRALAARRLRHAGQGCLSPAWVIAVGEAYEPLVDAMLEVIEEAQVGDPRKPGVRVGPLIARYLAEKAELLVRDAVSKGARPYTTGTAWSLYYPPTLLDRTPKAADVMDRDVQAPVIAVIASSTGKEAASVANSVKYATAVEVYSDSTREIDEITQRLEAPLVLVNPDSEAAYQMACTTPSSLPDDPATIAQAPLAGVTLRAALRPLKAEEDLY